MFQFWRFVLVQQEVAKAAQSFIEFPPMQKSARLQTVISMRNDWKRIFAFE